MNQLNNEDNIISLKKEVETKEVETKLFDKEEKFQNLKKIQKRKNH